MGLTNLCIYLDEISGFYEWHFRILNGNRSQWISDIKYKGALYTKMVASESMAWNTTNTWFILQRNPSCKKKKSTNTARILFNVFIFTAINYKVQLYERK